jgi:hypothetical protein
MGYINLQDIFQKIQDPQTSLEDVVFMYRKANIDLNELLDKAFKKEKSEVVKQKGRIFLSLMMRFATEFANEPLTIKTSAEAKQNLPKFSDEKFALIELFVEEIAKIFKYLRLN